MFKFHQIVKVSKGNKKDFKSNELTQALAEKEAKKDIKRERKLKLKG